MNNHNTFNSCAKYNVGDMLGKMSGDVGLNLTRWGYWLRKYKKYIYLHVVALKDQNDFLTDMLGRIEDI